MVAICQQCGKKHKLHAKRLCKTCYNRQLPSHKIYQIAWRRRHPKYNAQYGRKNKEQLAKKKQIYLTQHPEMRQKNEQTYRARRKGLPATLSIEQWFAIKRIYKNRCAYCNSETKNLVQEHVIPVSKGGGYTSENIVPACASCNARKGDKEPLLIPPKRLLL